MISEEALKSFKDLWLKEYGEEISNEKAVELGINLLTFFKHTHQPIKKSWLKEFESKKYENA